MCSCVGSRWRATGANRSRSAYAVPADDLAECTDAIADELARRARGHRRPRPLVALGRATSHLERTTELSAEVVLAQVRSLIADLLAVTGMDPLAATDQIPPLSA